MLTIDTFSQELQALTAVGWIVTEYSRYDPTHVAGLTPSGKTFVLDAVRQGAGASVTITVAGNTRNVALPSWDDDFEPGNKTTAAWLAAHRTLPVGQR